MKTTKPSRAPRTGRKNAAKKLRPSGSAGLKILSAIEEATAILRSEGLESKQLTIRIYKTAPIPRIYKSEDVKRVRELLGTSQAVLARFLGVNVNTVRSWEQGKRLPQPIAGRFLSEIEADPAYWRQRIGHDAFGA
jgi:putative transcriptional regulator